MLDGRSKQQDKRNKFTESLYYFYIGERTIALLVSFLGNVQ